MKTCEGNLRKVEKSKLENDNLRQQSKDVETYNSLSFVSP